VGPSLGAFLDELLGIPLKSEDLRVGHMVARAVVVFVLTLLLVRLGGKRLVGRNAAFDLVVAIVLGSLVSRAITGSAPFVPTLAAAATIVAVEVLISSAAYFSKTVAKLTEGAEEVLMEDGRFDRRRMARNRVTVADMAHACRDAELDGLDDAERVVLETNGRLSVLPRKGRAR
jgi:uncharacterized membrane protein YcaP (DUF421 family)